MIEQESGISTLASPAVQSNVLLVSGAIDLAQTDTMLQMPDGRMVRIPTALLMQPATHITGLLEAEQHLTSGARNDAGEPIVIPVVEERLSVGTRTVATGKVRLHKTVQVYEEALDEPLAVRTFDVERVILNQPVESAPAVRTEGETTIYPLVEEQLILTKHLVLKEEVRVTRRDTERRETQVVTLRREHLTVERAPADRE